MSFAELNQTSKLRADKSIKLYFTFSFYIENHCTTSCILFLPDLL